MLIKITFIISSSRKAPTLLNSSLDKDLEKVILINEIDKNLKYKTIKPFNNERAQLYGFLFKLRLYIKFNNKQFQSKTKQILWAITLLKEKAMH